MTEYLTTPQDPNEIIKRGDLPKIIGVCSDTVGHRWSELAEREETELR